MGGRGGSSGMGAGGARKDLTLLRGLPESEQKDIYYSTNDGIFRGMGAEEAEKLYKSNKYVRESAESDLKYNAVLFNQDLPDYQGTERQVKYARDLAIREVKKIIGELRDEYNTSNTTREEKSATLANAKSLGYGNDFNSVINKLVREDERYKYIMGTKRAGDIISRFR